MRPIALFLVVGVALLLPGRAPDAAPITFVATLTGAAESPPSGSPGTGHATVVIDPVANTLHVDVTFSGLEAGTTASHIHCCLPSPEAPENVGVATTTPTFPGFPLGVTAGTYAHDFSLLDPGTYNPAFVTLEGGTILSARNALVAGIEAGETYLNIHTTMFMGGEIRGFLVPEAATLLLLSAGLAGLAAWCGGGARGNRSAGGGVSQGRRGPWPLVVSGRSWSGRWADGAGACGEPPAMVSSPGDRGSDGRHRDIDRVVCVAASK